MPAGTGAGRGRPHGDRSVRRDGPKERSASTVQEPRPTIPTRQWEMTTQEQDMMACFRQDYLDLLEGRVATIQRLVGADQVEPARVALLSLESSSAMVGAEELVAAVRRLRAALDDGAHGDLKLLTAALAGEAGTARSRLAGRSA
jgi:hypothetical protein